MVKYLGGKAKLSKYIVQEINQRRLPGQYYVEPFVGAGHVFEKVDNPRFGFDIDPYIIAYLASVRDGWLPDPHLDEETYYRVKANPEEYHPAFVAHVKYGCSWGGKPWGGFARSNTGRDYANEAYRAAQKQHAKLQGAYLRAVNYENIEPENCIIYCDPPYNGTTGYENSIDHDAFWQKMREWSQNNTVLISEYTAPEDFVLVWERQVSTFKSTGSKKETEKLFIYCGVANAK